MGIMDCGCWTQIPHAVSNATGRDKNVLVCIESAVNWYIQKWIPMSPIFTLDSTLAENGALSLGLDLGRRTAIAATQNIAAPIVGFEISYSPYEMAR
ncbi:hypothetical protein E1B28_012797 [Marasmius oreades]|uniref:Uncharacterized protein n=1 Tax=Marasmius oreades TaxID=181124 RepID=A0A9P7RSH4_9AGAR|nr:uncharacterized protein E1B28_012797 [Marasmius oreades]KAG7088842.1 hypothetical protein E1B28_012797 [Marasmius oreades]